MKVFKTIELEGIELYYNNKVKNFKEENSKIFNLRCNKFNLDISKMLNTIAGLESGKYNLEILNKKKIDKMRQMFEYISFHKDIIYEEEYIKFRKVLYKKLLEFRYRNNLREACVWYRWIFGKRFPIEYSSLNSS